MNPNPSTATTGGNVAAPLFRLEHCSAESSSSGYFCDGLDVRQIREALTGHCLHECTNIPAVELTGQGSIAVSFKLVGRSRHEQRAGYRARGLCVGELRDFFANPMVATCDRTDVVEVAVVGMDRLFFAPADEEDEREYRIEGGNSRNGEVGFIAHIRHLSAGGPG